jgi:hypothetical protein
VADKSRFACRETHWALHCDPRSLVVHLGRDRRPFEGLKSAPIQRNMPPLSWTVDPMEVVKAFEARHNAPSAAALFAWALRTVETLHYLDDIDRAYDASHVPFGGYSPDVIDVAHARWATTSCVTAIDLCAAGLGRAFCGHAGRGERELDVRDFTPPSRANDRRRSQLPSVGLEWIDLVSGDPRYSMVEATRHGLTHRRLYRHFTLGAGGRPQRLMLEVGTEKFPVRQIIEDSRDCATEHVSRFLEILAQL